MLTKIRPVVALFSGIVLFIGLPLLGWGLTDIRGFINNPARLAYIIITVLLQIVLVVLIPDVGRNRGKGTKTVRRQHLALILLQILGIVHMIVAPYCDNRNIVVFNYSEIVRFIGLGLYVLAMIEMHWAEMVLGKQFSAEVAIQKGHKLVTNGPYRYLRHPRYLGIIMFYLGISLIFRSGIPLIILGAIIGVLLWRIHDEEALLQHEFGKEWEAYSRKSWRLIPFVY